MTLHVNSTHLDFLAAVESNDDGDDQAMRNFLEDDEFGGGGEYSSIWELVRQMNMRKLTTCNLVTWLARRS